MKNGTPKDIDSIFRNKLSDFEAETFPDTEEEIFTHFFSSEVKNGEERHPIIAEKNKNINGVPLKKTKSNTWPLYAIASSVSGILLLSYLLFIINKQSEGDQIALTYKERKITNTGISTKKESTIIHREILTGFKESVSTIKKAEEISPNKLIEVKAENEKIVFYLPDSSKIFLNKNSKVSYLDKFSDGHRHLYIAGEAYFDIKKSDKKHFVVKTDIGKVRVLGTSFNVKSLSDEKVEVIVETGKVLFSENSNPKNKLQLIPGMKASLERGKAIMGGTANNPNELSWKTDKIIFNQSPIVNVIQEIEEFYGIKVKVQDANLYESHFTGKFYRQDFVKEVLETLALSINASYQLKNKEHIIKNKGPN
jgi:hypothetical protein